MLQVEFEQEEDGRWLAEIPALPGGMAYGADGRSFGFAHACRQA